MAIIYSYPSTDPQSSDLLVITRQPSDPDETANYSVSVNKLSNFIIANLVNGTDNYIPKFDGTNSLVNSLFYETDTGRVGLGTTTPSKKFEVAGDAIFTEDLTISSNTTADKKLIIGNDNGAQTSNDFSILDITGKSSYTTSNSGAIINLNSGGSGVARINFNAAYDFTSKDSYRNAFVGYPGGNNDDFYIRQSDSTTPTNYAGFIISTSHVLLQGDGIRIGADNAANELDDYEEGTFTPNIGSYIGGTITPVYNSQLGEYTKVGNIVTASFYLSLDSSTTFSGAGDLVFGGLPFTVKDQASSPLQLVSQVSGTLSYFRKFDDTAMSKFVGFGRSITS